MEIYFVFVGGLLAGVFIAWFHMRQMLKVKDDSLKQLTSQHEALQKELQEAEDKCERQSAQREDLAIKCEVLQNRVELERTAHEQEIETRQQQYAETMAAQEQRHAEAIAAQQQRFDETMARVSAQVKDATGEMLRQRQREFQESSGISLGQIVTPLRETIDKMQQAMTDAQNKQSADSGTMKTIIEQMMQQNEATRRSTDELTRVFRHSNTVQGNWGETVLDELLESQGLTRGVHYDTQPTIRDAQGVAVTNETGARLRPDIILHLDQQRDVIIDSKVSLAAFMDYVNADNEADRQRYLKAHVASIQEQVNRLVQKDYSSYVQPPKLRMDYVIMFVPHTGALWTALSAQPDLWRKAMERGVYIADEQTLFAALRIISLTWTQIAQAQNHEKVFALASEMMDRVGQFMKKYQAIGTNLAKAQQAYEDAERKLQPSGQSILQTCAKLQKLGGKQGNKERPLPLTPPEGGE